MKKIIAGIGFILSSCSTSPKQSYTLVKYVYDSLGNETHIIKTYNHIPTQQDSINFYKTNNNGRIQ